MGNLIVCFAEGKCATLISSMYNMFVVPEPVYLLENLQRVNMSHNSIKELSSLIDTWQHIVTLDLSHNQVTALHVSVW